MQELPPHDENPDMIAALVQKKEQISGQHGATVHWLTQMTLVDGLTGQLKLESVSKNSLHQTRTIHTAPIRSADPVRNSLPRLILCHQDARH